MFRLILDTALEYSYLALLKDNQILNEAYDKGSNNHSETLMPKLELVLKENDITLRDINEVYVGIGPGSYTGVRIAVVIAKMIAAMNNIKLYKFSSLLSIASSVNGKSYPMVDCRRGNAYTASFDYKDGSLVRLEEDKIVKILDYTSKIDNSYILTSGKPNPLTLINSPDTKLVEDVNALSPNYLQLVEAERIKKGLLWKL